MNTLSLTDTQTLVLRAAAMHPEGRIDAFPENVKGGARDRVLQALFSRGLIRAQGDHQVLTDAGFSAIGLGRPAPLAPDEVAALEPDVAALEARWAAPNVCASVPKSPARRACPKQATLLAMLTRPEGASIAQLTEALGWQAHSVRGALCGVIKKKLGLALHCEKVAGGRRYRVQSKAQASTVTSSSPAEETAPLSQGV